MRVNIRSRGNLPLWGFLAMVMLVVAAAFGWVINIIKLFGIAQSTDPNYLMAALRAIGVFVAPLGAILGFL